MSLRSLNQPGNPLSGTESQHSAAPRTDVVDDPVRRRFRTSNVLTVAAITTAAASLLTFLPLPWTETAIGGNTSPAVRIVIGLLVPMSLLCLSKCRDDRSRQQPGKNCAQRLGPYRLIEKLGSGGMGDVFLAEHQLMKRQCAVKLIHPRHARDRQMRKSFEREAKATAQLTHWNTIDIYDYGTSDDGRFYYAMEYLTGVNLWQFVERYGPLTPGRTIYILKQLCDALHEADCAGLVHRDIKPGNIFLTERGRSFDVVKLLDFGLVQDIQQNAGNVHDASTRLHGSPSFMCPEQAQGLPSDTRGDLYSLGAVAYFLLTGRPPFVDENPIRLIVAHATMNVPTFEEIGMDVPVDLGAAILRCLSRDPAARFESSRKLREALERCSNHGDWTWQDAERWWHQFAPQSSFPPESPVWTDNTMTFDRDTTPQRPALPLTSHEEITAIVEGPAELWTA